MTDKIQYLKDKYDAVGIRLSEEQAQQLIRYYTLLTEWNKVMNLTAITEFSEVVEKHFIDSTLSYSILLHQGTAKLLDLGTGAGFPGIPLKILFPQLKVTLLDSLNKRIRFLGTVIDELGLSDIDAIHGRAEELGRKPEYREQFDICVSRAVARLASLCEFCIPFVKKNGIFIAYKSLKSQEEIEEAKPAIRALGSRLSGIQEFQLEDDSLRTLIIMEKIKETPSNYPRQGGKPLKSPITQ